MHHAISTGKSTAVNYTVDYPEADNQQPSSPFQSSRQAKSPILTLPPPFFFTNSLNSHQGTYLLSPTQGPEYLPSVVSLQPQGSYLPVPERPIIHHCREAEKVTYFIHTTKERSARVSIVCCLRVGLLLIFLTQFFLLSDFLTVLVLG